MQIYFFVFSTFSAAFCSIVYELLLGQILSAFLGNTVLRYSVTIGLYLFSMGIGSMLAEVFINKRSYVEPITPFLKIEILLSLMGGSSVILIHLLNTLHPSPFWLSSCSHFFIVIIGILTGFELPLLIEIGQRGKILKDNTILGINYLGSFIGTVCFAFLFYPLAGIMATAFISAILNIISGLSLLSLKHLVPKEKHPSFFCCHLFLLGLLFVFGCCLLKITTINEHFLQIYLAT